MASRKDQIGRGLAKVLGIKLEQHHHEPVTRGESVFSVNTADSYIEEEPTVGEFLSRLIPSGRGIVNYLLTLFPFLNWILSYNLQWLAGDLVAGITVGAVVVPQSMAYAGLANLPPQYGLYSSFMGVIIYWFFATSKDITIGPVAVMSTIVGNIVNEAKRIDPSVDGHIVASALAIILGAIAFIIGVLRLGRITELITLPTITAFMTGSAINIAVGQFPGLMGLGTWVNSRDSTYLVIINSLKYLGYSQLDAAMGVTALAMLYIIRAIFNYLSKAQPDRRRTWFFCNTLRVVFVILLYTMISWLVNRNLPHNPKKARFKILGDVPRGFTWHTVPTENSSLIRLFASQIPVSFIVLLIEHISISKSFGRVNNYKIDPSQELVAIGVTNLLGPFLGAYPATGSFSRTAIKSKAGVRTPLAGVITGVVVLLAIYALPAVFYYIPSASLSAVIIHAVGDLITPPNTVYQFWRVSPLEVVIFFAGVLTIIFSTIEYGVYVTMSASALLYVWRLWTAKGRLLGKVQVRSVAGGEDVDGKATDAAAPGSTRTVFIPVDSSDGSNPEVTAESPYPGVFIYRFTEGLVYPNANTQLEQLTDIIFAETRATNQNMYARPGDRPWNDPAPRRGKKLPDTSNRPTLKAIILDFSTVNNFDITSLQALIDVRNQLDRYVAPERVQWHFAGVHNRWTKRGLVSAGFGLPPLGADSNDYSRWKPLYSVAEIGGQDSAAAWSDERRLRELQRARAAEQQDPERGEIHPDDHSSSNNSIDKGTAAIHSQNLGGAKGSALVHGLNRPFFHIDVAAALESTIHHIDGLNRGQVPESKQVQSV